MTAPHCLRGTWEEPTLLIFVQAGESALPRYHHQNPFHLVGALLSAKNRRVQFCAQGAACHCTKPTERCQLDRVSLLRCPRFLCPDCIRISGMLVLRNIAQDSYLLANCSTVPRHRSRIPSAMFPTTDSAQHQKNSLQHQKGATAVRVADADTT